MPLEAINVASVREKSIRHGHPSTLHLWWARRPLAACRAVLFAQLVDDPSSHPDKFPTEVAVVKERKRLFEIIEELVKWENSTNEEVLERARAEIRKSCGGELPPVYDPFSGGCSIPLEAQRLGLPAYGSDLNPVAVTVGKAMIEIPFKFKDMEPVRPGQKERQIYHNAEGLAEDVKYYSEWIYKEAYERIGHLYPKIDILDEQGEELNVIAWIWARTVPSPDPAFADVQVPLISNFILCSKTGKEAWIEPIVDKTAKTITYQIRHGGTKEELLAARQGTKNGRGTNFKCLFSDTAITSAYIREHANSIGFGASLIAIVCEGKKKRVYVEPHEGHSSIAKSAQPQWRPVEKMNQDTKDLVSGRGYDFTEWHQLFTDRQLVALTTFSDLVREVREQIEKDALLVGMTGEDTLLNNGGIGAKAYAEAISVYLSFIVDKCSSYQSSFCIWMSSGETVGNIFGRQAIPMVWDYPEVNPFSSSTGSWESMQNQIGKVIKNLKPKNLGQEIQHDAQTVSYPSDAVISTDPPYYDNICYADLSDYFFIWLKQILGTVFPDLFNLLATPKEEELVASRYRYKEKEAAAEFFLNGMAKAISNMANQVSSDYPITLYYAFKQSEIEKEGISSTGWATFLEAVVIKAGYTIVGTWPMRTERPSGSRVGKNALTNSVVLVCRKRLASSKIVTRSEFISALKHELPPAIQELKTANIAPADMPQSAIGPGMGVFSRYQAVLEADDSQMSVKTALQLINHELDEFLNDLEGEFDSETRFAVLWFEQNGYDKGEYGVADNLARARGISAGQVEHAGIIESVAGKVRIWQRSELSDDWSPETDKHLTIWECCQYLIRTLENDGEDEAAQLLQKFDGGQVNAVKDLAYYLYDICETKRKDAKEAMAYNGLIAVWPDLIELASKITNISQLAMDT